jgi:hypothetical protein
MLRFGQTSIQMRLLFLAAAVGLAIMYLHTTQFLYSIIIMAFILHFAILSEISQRARPR